MGAKKLTDDFSVSGQITVDDIPALAARGQVRGVAHCNGEGSCPLTVEQGKIVLHKFGCSGKLLPSFAQWVINGQRPSRLAWYLKKRILPPVYWQAMLKGKEWMVDPQQAKQHAAAPG